MIVRFVTSCSARLVTSILKTRPTDFTRCSNGSHASPLAQTAPLVLLIRKKATAMRYPLNQIRKHISTDAHRFLRFLARTVTEPYARLTNGYVWFSVVAVTARCSQESSS